MQQAKTEGELQSPANDARCKVTPGWDTEYPLLGLPIEQVRCYSRILIA